MKKKYTVNLIVGLGNYGEKFDGTRHNIGFEVLEKINSPNKQWNPGEHGFWCLDKYNSAILIKPITGMNMSGIAIKDGCESLANKHPCKIIVIYDDMDFNIGVVKIKDGGGDGKHNGLKSIIKYIGNNFIRVRVGIGKPESKEKGIDHVLGKFKNSEYKKINQSIDDAAEAVILIIKNGVAKAMGEFNGRYKNV